MDINKAIILGKTTSEPVFNITNDNSKLAYFSIATNKKWTDKEGAMRDETTFHRVIAWGRLAEIVRDYVHKGKEVFIVGRINNKTIVKDEQVKHLSQIVIEELELGKGTKVEVDEEKNIQNKEDFDLDKLFDLDL